MDVPEFELERWFAEHEHGADMMLAESGVRSLRADRFDLDAGDMGYVIPTNGDPALRETIGVRHDHPPDEVLCTCGTQEANFVAFHALLDPGDHAVVVTPTYGALDGVPSALADVTRVELEPPDWRLDPDDVAAAMRPETAVVVVVNPNNPTGRHHDRATVEALYDLAADHDAYLLCDEVYRLLDPDPVDPVASMGPRGISTGSLTKAYGLAGLRFGWLVGPESVIDRAWRWKDYTTISPPAIGQHVARQALGDREDAILAENRRLARRNRRIVADWIEAQGLDWHEPAGVNGFPTVPAGYESARAFCESVLDREGVLLAPGEAFGVPDRFRIGFGVPTPTLREGLDRVGSCIE